MLLTKKYENLEKELLKSDTSLHPSEAHGFMTGQIIINNGQRTFDLGLLKLNAPLNENACALLEELFTYTQEQLKNFSFEFSLLLPEDKASVHEKSQALVFWVEGFLTALNQHSFLKKKLPEESAEVLDDFLDIAQLDYDEDLKDKKQTKQNEINLFEIIEYVRMGVLMIFQDSQKILMPTAKFHNDKLH